MIKKESDFHYQFAAQISSLSRRIHKKWGIGLEELHQLETIYLVCLDKTEIIRRVMRAAETSGENTSGAGNVLKEHL